MFIGLILIAIGVIALLRTLGILTGSVWNYTWPIILIVLGLSFLSGHFFGRGGGRWYRRWGRFHSDRDKG